MALVEGNGLVILTAASAVLALERAPVEQGEGNRRGHASKAGAAGEQVAEPEGRQTDQRAQIHVGIESRLGLLDAIVGTFDTRTSGGDVGASCDEFDRCVRRNALRLKGADLRPGDCQRAIRSVTDQGSKCILGQRDRFVGRIEIGLRLRNASFRLLQLRAGIEAAGSPQGHELQRFRADS